MDPSGKFLTTIPHPVIRVLAPALGLAGRHRLPPRGLPIDPDPIGRLLSSRRSLVRWGDGETRVLLGGDIAFQRSDPSLRRALLRILRTASSRTDLELAATPRIESHAFRTSSETDPGQRPLDPSPLLGTSECFVLVASKRVIDRARGAFPDHDIRTVPIPPRDAYGELPRILAELDRVHRSPGVAESTPTIVSAGPAGKVLVATRAERRQLYDLGSFHVHLRAA